MFRAVKVSKTKTEEPQPQKQAEEKRLRPFRKAQPRKFDVIWERATSERFFVLKRERCDAEDCPQEEFELAGTTGNVYSIKIARQPQCNCPYALKGNQCKHVIHVRTRFLSSFILQRMCRSILKQCPCKKNTQWKEWVANMLSLFVLLCARFASCSQGTAQLRIPAGAAEQRAQGHILETSPVRLRR